MSDKFWKCLTRSSWIVRQNVQQSNHICCLVIFSVKWLMKTQNIWLRTPALSDKMTNEGQKVFANPAASYPCVILTISYHVTVFEEISSVTVCSLEFPCLWGPLGSHYQLYPCKIQTLGSRALSRKNALAFLGTTAILYYFWAELNTQVGFHCPGS